MKHIKIKLNGGNTIVQCSHCNKTIRRATCGESLNPPLFPREYCDDCLTELINKCTTEKF